MPQDCAACAGRPSSALMNTLSDPAVRMTQIKAARQQFPAGLYQPEGSFRFSMDALLLARFGLECLAEIRGDCCMPRFADLGTGCGVVGLALLLWSKTPLYGIGIEREACLVKAARINTRRLGLERRYAVVCRDLADYSSVAGLSHRIQLVLSNPPWLLHRSCRVSSSHLRRAALIGDESTFFCFMAAAGQLLEEAGRVVMVTAVERYDDALAAMRGAGLFPYRVCLIETRAGAPARRLLLEGGRRPGVLHEYTRIAQDGILL